MKMDDAELKAIIQAETSQALGYTEDELSTERDEGWDAYLKKPYGNEMEGRSAVVSSDVQDTIEWILPSLIRIFSSGKPVEFVPHTPDDVPKAEQATDTCIHVWMNDNCGFLNTYTWFKDALISKNGFVKIYWEDREEWKKERYSNMSEDAFAVIVAEPDREIIEHTLNEDGTHDVVTKFKRESGKICVDPTPSDEILYSRDAKDVQSCRFFAHRRRVPRSDLIEEYPKFQKEIEEIGSDEGPSEQSLARTSVNEETEQGIAIVNEAMQEVWVTEAYIRVDYDGDGIAEMRKVTCAGSPNGLMLSNEEWAGPRPFAALTPIIMPHRLTGLSIPDLIKDIQLIKTTVLRQYLDALYLANNPTSEVDIDKIEDPSDLTTRKPGGYIRVTNTMGQQVVRPVPLAFAADAALSGMEYIDQLRENRTGVSQRTQGLGSNALHETASGEQLLYSAAQQRIELIARIFAETGVKDAFKLILWLLCTYQNQKKIVRLRGQFVEMSPSEWEDNYDMEAKVGLGHLPQEMKLQLLSNVAALQMKAVELQGGAQGPLVTTVNLFNTGKAIISASGLDTPTLYFSDPAVTPPPPPKPDPEMMKAQAQIQLEQEKAKINFELEKIKAQMQSDLDDRKLMRQGEIEAAQAKADIAVQRQKAEVDMDLEKQKAELEAQLKIIDMKAKLAQIKAQNGQGGEFPDIEAEDFVLQEDTKTRDAVNESMNVMAQAVNMLSQAIDAMSRPKQVVRGPDGKVIGLQ